MSGLFKLVELFQICKLFEFFKLFWTIEVVQTFQILKTRLFRRTLRIQWLVPVRSKETSEIRLNVGSQNIWGTKKHFESKKIQFYLPTLWTVNCVHIFFFMVRLDCRANFFKSLFFLTNFPTLSIFFYFWALINQTFTNIQNQAKQEKQNFVMHWMCSMTQHIMLCNFTFFNLF